MSIDKKIFSEKLYFKENALSKIKSLENIDHQPKCSDKQIYNEYLPWLRFNKPNLPVHIKEQINRKKYLTEYSNKHSSSNSLDNGEETLLTNKKTYFPKLNSEKIERKSKNIEKENSQTSENILDKNKKSKNEVLKQKYDSNSSESSSIHRKQSTKENVKSLSKTYKEPYKINTMELQSKTCDVSTETDIGSFVSVEVQTMEDVTKSQTKKLLKALKNSNTYENNYSLILERSKKSQIKKPEREVNDQKEEIITSRVIENILPSISYYEKEKRNKYDKPYAQINYDKNVTGDSSKIKHSVTHAGMDFLDQYWASQRWLTLNRQSNITHRARSDSFISESKTEMPFVVNMKGIKESDHKDKSTFRDMFNERIQYYTDHGDHHIYKPNVDLIKSKDLENIVQ